MLEHIADDRAQLSASMGVVGAGGHIVVLAPAHNWLFSKFDESIGHCRRHNPKMLRQIPPPGCDLVSLAYLDSIGMMLSLANALVLRRAMPTAANIRFWDRAVIPVSRVVDPLTRFSVGKTIVAIWRKR